MLKKLTVARVTVDTSCDTLDKEMSIEVIIPTGVAISHTRLPLLCGDGHFLSIINEAAKTHLSRMWMRVMVRGKGKPEWFQYLRINALNSLNPIETEYQANTMANKSAN